MTLNVFVEETQAVSDLGVDPSRAVVLKLHSSVEVDDGCVLGSSLFPRIAVFQPVIRLLALYVSTTQLILDKTRILPITLTTYPVVCRCALLALNNVSSRLN